VNKKASDWDTKLGPVLMAYRTTPQSSTRVSLFYLMYGRDARLPSALDMAVESVYGRELFQELKKVRELVRKNIKRVQGSLNQGSLKDLVMLNVDPKFKQGDCAFHGLYRVHQITYTCACIQPVNRPEFLCY